MDTMQDDSNVLDAGLREDVKEKARTLGQQATTRVVGEIDQRRGAAAGQVRSVSAAIQKVAGELGDTPQWLQSALHSGARTIDWLADTVEHKDARTLGRDLQQISRSNPAVFLGTCALLGFAAARVLKAGSAGGQGQDDGGGQQTTSLMRTGSGGVGEIPPYAGDVSGNTPAAAGADQLTDAGPAPAPAGGWA